VQSNRPSVYEPGDRERLTSDWLNDVVSQNEDLFWAYEAMADLIDEDPRLACENIFDLRRRAPTKGAFDLAAAGPLEDLVAWHGREVIDLIEPRVLDQPGPSSLLKRFATLEAVANMIVSVCSPLASATNGAALRVNGGVVRAIV
jgi:hypothetical protein